MHVPFTNHRGSRLQLGAEKLHSGFLPPPLHVLLVDWSDGEGRGGEGEEVFRREESSISKTS